MSQDQVQSALTPERMEELRSIFKQMAEEKGDSDSIDKATYLEHFDRKGISGDSLLQFERMFDAMDYKGTGKLNFDEFLTSMYIINAEGNIREKLELCFRVYDSNRDGFISRKEAFSVAKSMVMLSQLGILGLMGLDSTMMVMVRREMKKQSAMIKQAVQAVIDDMFERLDTNKDGKISFDEWMAQADEPRPDIEAWLKAMQPGGEGNLLSGLNIEEQLTSAAGGCETQ